MNMFEKNDKFSSPIIVLGAHRSGTSMLTRCLLDHGVFLGSKRQADDESTFFVDLNEWIMSLAGASWDTPQAVYELMSDQDAVGRIAQALKPALRGRRTYSFLGKNIFRHRGSIQNGLSEIWGWKDPRTSLTLPVWLKLFPDAKVLRVSRHGVDVANSLYVRHKKLEPSFGQYSSKSTLPHRDKICHSPQCKNLQAAFDLWVKYEQAINQHVLSVPSNRYLSLRFEDVVTNPKAIFDHLERFLDIPISKETLSLKAVPDASRAFVYRNDPELLSFSSEKKSVLNKLGY